MMARNGAALLAACTLLAFSQSATAQTLYTRTSINCNEQYYAVITGKPFQSGMQIVIDVEDWRRLADETFRLRVLDAAFQENLEYCRSKNIPAGLAAVLVRKAGHNLLIAWMSAADRRWNVSHDGIAKRVAELDAEEARRKAEQAREEARKEAERRARELRKVKITLPDYDVDRICSEMAKGSGVPNPAAFAIECIKTQQLAYDGLKPVWDTVEAEVQNDCRALNDRPAWQRFTMDGSWPYGSLRACIDRAAQEAAAKKKLEGTKFRK